MTKTPTITALLLLTGCSSAPAEPFEPTTPHALVGFSLVDGRACPIYRLKRGTTVWCGPHRIGDGPDIWDSTGVIVDAFSEDE